MTQRPKIVQVTFGVGQGTGGVLTAVSHFRDAFCRWAEHVVVDFSEGGCLDWPDVISLATTTSYMGRRFGCLRKGESVKGEAACSGADLVVIHVPYRRHAGWAASWCLRNNVPYLFVPHGAFDPYVFTYRVWRKRLWLFTEGRRMLRGAAFILYATLGEALKAERAVGALPRQILPWPTPVPANVDRLGAAARLRQRYGLAADTRVLLFLGRLHPMKRPKETVIDFVAVQPKGWHLLVAGPEDGVTLAELRALGGPVTVCGSVFGEAKAELLAGSDALALFSHRENFGFVVAESLAHGTPVVVSEELDLAPELRTRECGWVVDGRTAASRQAALQSLAMLAAAECTARGARGIDWVHHEMSAERFQNRLRAMIETAVSGKGTNKA